jgi:hypothetical protein
MLLKWTALEENENRLMTRPGEAEVDAAVLPAWKVSGRDFVSGTNCCVHLMFYDPKTLNEATPFWFFAHV